MLVLAFGLLNRRNHTDSASLLGQLP